METEWEMNKVIEIEDLKAELKSMSRIVKIANKRLEKAKEIELKNKKWSKKNLRVTSDIVLQVKRLRDDVASTTGLIESIEQEAIENKKQIEEGKK